MQEAHIDIPKDISAKISAGKYNPPTPPTPSKSGVQAMLTAWGMPAARPRGPADVAARLPQVCRVGPERQQNYLGAMDMAVDASAAALPAEPAEGAEAGGGGGSGPPRGK